MSPRPVAVGALGTLFLVMLPDPRALDLVLALIVALAALRSVGPSPLRETEVRPSPLPRLAAVPALAGLVAADVVTGTWRVSLAVLGVRPPREPGVVRVPVAGCSERAAVVTGIALTLSPGAVLVDYDREAGVLLVHVVDGDEPEAASDRQQRLHELVKKVVG